MGIRGYEAGVDGSDYDELWTEDVSKSQGRITDVGLYPQTYASYIVFAVGATHYARNSETGVIADSNAVLLTLTQALNDRLTAASGGVIYLKDLEEPGTTLDDDVLVIEDFEGIRRVYSNQGQYMPFTQLAADPATGGWGANEEGFWWYNTTTNLFKYWNGAAVVTFAAGGAPAAHAASHQNAGGDEVNVAGLSGLLADDQHVLDAEVLAVAAAVSHEDTHVDGGTDEIDSSLDGRAIGFSEQGDVVYASGATTLAALAHGNAGQVLTSGGHAANPSWGAGGGGGNYPIFISVSDPNSNKGRHKTVLMDDGVETTIREEFYIPSGFSSLTTAVAIVIPLGTGNLDWEIATHFTGNGEQFDVHADSTTGTTAVTNGEREQFDISAALTGIAADDLVGIEFKRDGDDAADTVGAGVHLIGFYILVSG